MNNLTDAERALLQAQLTDARAAFQSLITGTQAAEVVDQNGERVVFTPANRSALYLHIQRLESQLATIPAACRVLGPAGFIF
jgi:quinolinate synthase